MVCHSIHFCQQQIFLLPIEVLRLLRVNFLVILLKSLIFIRKDGILRDYNSFKLLELKALIFTQNNGK